MFNNENGGYSLSDVAAVTRNNNGGGWFGGDGSWWIIILFLFVFAGWGGNGYGLFGGGGATASGITDGYVLTSDFANIERKIDTVNGGLCDGFYAMNTGMLNGFANTGDLIQGAQSAVTAAINADTIANMQNTNAITAQLTSIGTQMSAGFCEDRFESSKAIGELNYKLAEQSCATRQAVADATQAITSSADANTRSILAAIQDMQTQALHEKIETLSSDNQALKFAASQQAQNAYLLNALSPSPAPAYLVPNPYTGAYGRNGGCGCNSTY